MQLRRRPRHFFPSSGGSVTSVMLMLTAESRLRQRDTAQGLMISQTGAGNKQMYRLDQRRRGEDCDKWLRKKQNTDCKGELLWLQISS